MKKIKKEKERFFQKISTMLFDKHCEMCDGIANFVEKRLKKENKFYFFPLGSPTGKKIFNQISQKTPQNKDSVIFLSNKKISFKSDAFLQIVRSMHFPWNFFFVFIILPKPLRDFFYDVIAKKRHLISSLLFRNHHQKCHLKKNSISKKNDI